MEKVTLSVSPLPPFVAINIDIPIEKIIKGYQKLTDRKIEIANTLIWTLGKILEDQWTEKDTDASGAWSIRYPEYLEFYYRSSPLPPDISPKDTISFSSWIVRPLLNFLNHTEDIKLKKAILPRIFYHKEYLLRHFDKSVGGFGLTRYTSVGTVSLAVDIRHTAWALLSLIDINEIDNSIEKETFIKTGKYLFNKLNSIDEENERALTFAVMHQVLTNGKAKSLIAFNDRECKRLQKSVENALIAKYNKYYSSWDLEIDDKNQIKIINALFILMSMDIKNILEDELIRIVNEVIEYLYSYLIELDNGKLALPFVEGEEPDIGTTIQFFSILTANEYLEEMNKKTINGLAKYIFDLETIKIEFRFAYPFHISQIFYYTRS